MTTELDGGPQHTSEPPVSGPPRVSESLASKPMDQTHETVTTIRTAQTYSTVHGGSKVEVQMNASESDLDQSGERSLSAIAPYVNRNKNYQIKGV